MKLGPYGMAPSSYEMSQCVSKASCLVGLGVGIVSRCCTSGRGVRDCEDALRVPFFVICVNKQ
jgi:hypothetical protein